MIMGGNLGSILFLHMPLADDCDDKYIPPLML